MTIIDISRYQGTVDFAAVKASGVSRVIAKMGGTDAMTLGVTAGFPGIRFASGGHIISGNPGVSIISDTTAATVVSNV